MVKYVSKKATIIVSIFIFIGIVILFGMDVHAAEGTRIHVVSIFKSDAILLESNGRFGMVDSGEDSDYPDGSNSKYPLRTGIDKGVGYEKEVIDYMKSVGVTADNFEFYIGTHPHSDHIGTADDIIREFYPERVYIMEYSDEYISKESGLFDNLYVYDQMIDAAKDVGAVIIQNFDTNAPVVPEQLYTEIQEPSSPEENQKEDGRQYIEMDRKEVLDTYSITMPDVGNSRNPEELPEEGVTVVEDNSPNSVALDAPDNTTGNPNFNLGSMSIEIMNYSDDYKTYPKPDANYFSLGVKVSANGKSAFLAGDIGAYDGDEVRLAPAVGSVNVLKLGHHGLSSANSTLFLNMLAPDIAIQTGAYSYLSDSAMLFFDNFRTRLFTTSYFSGTLPAVVMDFSGDTIISNTDGYVCLEKRKKSPFLTYFENGIKTTHKGFEEKTNKNYYFNNDCYASESTWVKDGSVWYYLQSDGTLATEQWIGNCYVDKNGAWLPDKQKPTAGWKYISGNWYYVDAKGNEAIGWKYIDKRWYYFDQNKVMVKGWKCISGDWFFMDQSGAMVSSQWLWSSGKCYYLSGSGQMLTSQWIGDSYVNDSGAWVPSKKKHNIGWQYISGHWYYYNASDRYLTGWQYIDNTWYYLASDGHMLANEWFNDYYLGPSGAWLPDYKDPQYGWHTISGNKYYYDKQGKITTGWKYIGNYWYYFYYSGVMASDKWVWDGDKCYYLLSNGMMAVNRWVQSGDKHYYLSSDGHMLTDTWIGDVYVDSTGARVDN